jgi:hypothetical protein
LPLPFSVKPATENAPSRAVKKRGAEVSQAQSEVPGSRCQRQLRPPSSVRSTAKTAGRSVVEKSSVPPAIVIGPL